MPCDSVQTSSVEFKPEYSDFFKKALISLGYTVTMEGGHIHGEKGWRETVTLIDGRLEITSRNNIDADVFKRAYSQEVIKFAAEEYGFELNQTSANEFEAVKAAF